MRKLLVKTMIENGEDIEDLKEMGLGEYLDTNQDEKYGHSDKIRFPFNFENKV